MSKTKFTPGPWVRWKGHNAIFAATDKTKNTSGSMSSTRGQICDCDDGDFDDEDFDNESDRQARATRANADLIAAAPELYVALEEARELYKIGALLARHPFSPSLVDEATATISKIDAVLKKARGE